MTQATIQMIPGDDTHLTLLMAPQSLNFCTGQDREHLLAFGRSAFEAGKTTAEQGKCLLQIAEPAEYPALPKHLMLIDQSDDDTFGALADQAWNSDFADDLKLQAPMFTAGQMRAYVDADRAQRAAAPQAAQGLDAPWIHVSERLPELRQQVLAGYFYQDTWLKGMPWVFSVGVCSMYENPEDPCFPQGKRWQTHGCSHNDIAYWMPMPKSPELPKALAAQAKQWEQANG